MSKCRQHNIIIIHYCYNRVHITLNENISVCFLSTLADLRVKIKCLSCLIVALILRTLHYFQLTEHLLYIHKN